MCPDVALQQPRPGEALATVRTLAALVVGPEVHGVGWHGNIGLVAMWALPSLFVFQRSMGETRILTTSNNNIMT